MSRCASPHDEAGLTLVELLVTVVVMTVAFVIVVGGLGVGVVGSDIQSRQASAQAVLRSVAEAVRSEASTHYGDCNASYPVPSVPLPPGFEVAEPVVVGRWDATTNRYQLGPCAAPDSGLQLVRVTVTSPTRPVVEEVHVVKRRP